MNRLRVYSTAEKVALEVYEKKQKVCHELWNFK
jgi:hypothetical protein